MNAKVAIVVTSHDEYTGHDRPTGLWLSELVHFTDVIESEAVGYDLVSPKGGAVPIEPKSLQGTTYDRATREKHRTPSYMEQLTRTRKALLPFVPFVRGDGRLVTGQNPGSATRTARKTLEVLRRVEQETSQSP